MTTPVEHPIIAPASAPHPDVLIVGAGPAGLALARSLALHSSPSHPRKILILERDLNPAGPDRIVGELLQPGGVRALKQFGLQGALEGIGAVRAKGYCVVNTGEGKQADVPYPDGEEGRSFHHGRFVAALRREVASTPGVELREATVNSLLECPHTGRVLGVTATPKNGEPQPFLADLVVVADGHASKFRHLLPRSTPPATRSHFVGLILPNARLPVEEHGTVVLIPNQGPVLMYGLAEGETRILIDVRGKLPSAASGALQSFIREQVLPHLPPGCQQPLEEALQTQRLRSMPNSFLPPSLQATPQAREGVLLIGDAFNMRHPLTGGGMTVAFTDAVLLGQLLAPCDNFQHWPSVAHALHVFHYARKPLSSTVNILSLALYDLFGAASPELAMLRQACFDYFLLGGECVKGPVSLLSGLAPRPGLLFYHFFAVALFAVWQVLTGSASSASTSSDGRVSQQKQHQGLTLSSFGRILEVVRLLWVACVVFLPLMWTEMRDVALAWWWSLCW